MPKKRVDTDEFESAIRTFIATAAGFGWVLCTGLLYLRFQWNLFFCAVVALAITAAAFGMVLAVMKLQGRAIDGFFGRGREPDQDDQEWESLKDGAKAAERERDWSELVYHLKAQFAHPKSGGSPMTAFRIGEVYDERLSRSVDALYWYRKSAVLIRELNPENPEAHPLWAPVHTALAEVTHIRDSQGQFLGEELQSAKDEIDRGVYDDAVKRLKDLTRRYPNDAELFFLLGVAEGRLGRTPLAAERYREAVRIDPTHLRAWFNLGATNFNLERFPEARDAWLTYLASAENVSEEADFVEQAKSLLTHVEAELKPDIDAPLSD